jgi:hypothetical protein
MEKFPLSNIPALYSMISIHLLFSVIPLMIPYPLHLGCIGSKFGH